MRKLAYFHKGLLKGKFVLVDFPGVLLAGFVHHLRCLKFLSTNPEIAFRETIAPDRPKARCFVGPPAYATHKDFEFNLSALDSSDVIGDGALLRFRPAQDATANIDDGNILHTLESKTTLDKGQAKALYEMLNRKLAFTQGPPGTGQSTPSFRYLLYHANGMSPRASEVRTARRYKNEADPFTCNHSF